MIVGKAKRKFPVKIGSVFVFSVSSLTRVWKSHVLPSVKPVHWETASFYSTVWIHMANTSIKRLSVMLWAIEGTLSTEFVTESKRTRRSSDFLPVHCWCFQFLPQRLNVHVRRYRGTVSVSLPATLWQIWSPNLLFCCKKGLTPELWMLRKALSCHRSAVSSCLEAADSSLSHCHNSSVAASWTPVHLQPNAFLFFFIPPAPLPWADFIPYCDHNLSKSCAGVGGKKSDMSLSPRNMKPDAGKNKK